MSLRPRRWRRSASRSIYRVHDAPSLAKQESLRDFLTTIDMSLARGAQLRPASSTRILERVQGSDTRRWSTRSCCGRRARRSTRPENIGHFGLNLRRYAHFTSPIRRYADLIVHRALISCAETRRGRHCAGRGGAAGGDLGADLGHRAPRHGRRTRHGRPPDRHLSRRKIDQTFDARISGVTKSGLFVQLPTFGADGFIPISSLGDDYYHFDEGARALFGEPVGKGFQLADLSRSAWSKWRRWQAPCASRCSASPRPCQGRSVRSTNRRRASKAGKAARFTAGGRAGDEHDRTTFWERSRFLAANITPAALPASSGPPCGAAFKANARAVGKAICSRPLPKTVRRCAVCGEEIHHHRADDLPAYLVIIIVGHIMLGSFMGVELMGMVELAAFGHLGAADHHSVPGVAPTGQGCCHRPSVGELHAWLRRRGRSVRHTSRGVEPVGRT